MNECEITRDLIPGYADEVLSPSGREYVEAHTADCPECMDILEKAKATVVTGNVAENVKAKKPFKRVNFKKIIIISASALLGLVLIIFAPFAINDANSGYYNLNRLFGNDPYQGILNEGIRQNNNKILEVTGYDCEDILVLSDFYPYTMYSHGYSSRIYSTFLSPDEKRYLIYVEGKLTGIGTYKISEFIISGENENGSLSVINSDGGLYCVAEKYSDYSDEIILTQWGAGTYQSRIIELADKDSFIARKTNEYAEYWTLEQATEMAKTDWEQEVIFFENELERDLRTLREEYKLPEEVIEKWMSYAE